jgi:peroxiredoxin
MAKKKSIYILSFLLIIIVLSVIMLSKFVHHREEKQSAYQSVPAFSLPNISGQIITEKSLQKHNPSLFLFFDSGCELCHEELEQIQIHQDAFQSYPMIFFSIEPANKIRDFLEELHFSPTNNMFFLIDTNEILVNTMKIKGPPTSLIYDKNGNLLKRYDGPVKIETLIKYLSE